MTSGDRFRDPDVKRRVIEAYERGDKIRDIELSMDVPRSTIYWILEQAELSPNRAQRGRRIAGNDQQLANLYALITAQDVTIKELTIALRDAADLAATCGATPEQLSPFQVILDRLA
jgi:transposase-like protein